MTMRARTMLQCGLTAVVVCVPGGARAQQQPSSSVPESIVKVGLFDTTGSAYSTPRPDNTFTSTVHLSACSKGAGGRAPMLATDVWTFDGRVVSASPAQATVQVNWRRVRAAGQEMSQPSTSVELTLGPGDRVPLDTVTTDAADGCPAREVSLEVRFEPRGEFRRFSAAGDTVRGGGASSSAAGGVANVAVSSTSGGSTGGSGGGGGIVGGARTGTAGARGPIGVARVGGGLVTGVRGTTVQHALKADVWLVHSAPGRPDAVLHTETAATSGGGDFAFPPVAIALPTGSLNVSVAGITELGPATSDRRFAFSATRRVSFTPSSGQARDSSANTASGSTRSIGPVPGPEEVVSYEMPPIQMPGVGDVPDRFSIRVRLTPVQIPQ
jgi:hypothetical protein